MNDYTSPDQDGLLRIETEDILVFPRNCVKD